MKKKKEDTSLHFYLIFSNFFFCWYFDPITSSQHISLKKQLEEKENQIQQLKQLLHEILESK